jgi:hypothetical protein
VFDTNPTRPHRTGEQEHDGDMRGPVAILLLALLALLAATLAACGDAPEQAGCGLADARRITALTGADPTATRSGSIEDLKRSGEPLRCTTGTHDRSVDIQAIRHPDPMPYPKRHCAEGWVFAGSPDDYAPACQVHRGSGGTTLLLHRAGDYVVTVAVRRSDLDWAGDAELALVIADQVGDKLS